jgi:hypothetical protein
MAIQQSGPRDIGFFGTRNMGFLHQQLIEILSYAMVLTVRARRHIVRSSTCLVPALRAVGSRAALRAARRAQENHIFTSGATGTNAAVIRGARAARQRADAALCVRPCPRTRSRARVRAPHAQTR